MIYVSKSSRHLAFLIFCLQLVSPLMLFSLDFYSNTLPRFFLPSFHSWVLVWFRSSSPPTWPWNIVQWHWPRSLFPSLVSALSLVSLVRRFSYYLYIRMFSHSVVSDSAPPLDCSLPSPSIQGVFQARILEQVAISYSRGSSQPRDRIRISSVSWISRWDSLSLAPPGKSIYTLVTTFALNSKAVHPTTPP